MTPADHDFVRRVALSIHRKLPHSVDPEDLIHAGVIGYLEASASYDPDRGASIETHTYHRVLGAVYDALRRNDWTPRSVHRTARAIARAAHEIESRELRPARHREIAQALDLSTEQYHQALADIHVGQPDSIEDLHASPTPEPTEALETSTLHHALRTAIKALPPREQKLVTLRYRREYTFAAAGADLGVTEARAHQIHTALIQRLRNNLRGYP
jgi:RNA polymerase sigma factor FliA